VLPGDAATTSTPLKPDANAPEAALRALIDAHLPPGSIGQESVARGFAATPKVL